MSGITSTLDIAKQALLAHQLSVQVASHNIANVDTPGYTRQSLSLTTALPTDSSLGTIGNGVEAETILRHYDAMLTSRIMDQNSTMGNLETQEQSLKVLETLFNEAGGLGLNELANQFWDSWQSLADSPESTVARQQVVQQGEILADQLQYMYSEITRLRTDIEANIGATVDDINSLSAQIADLNQQIVSFTTPKTSSNDLLDQRDELVRQLSEKIDVTYFQTSNGSYSVLLPDGHALVEDNTSATLSWQNNTLYWQGGSSLVPVGGSSEPGGSLGGLVSVHDQLTKNDPDNYLGRLDGFANALIQEINQQHAQGVGLEAFSGIITGSEATDATQLLSTLSYGAAIDTAAGSFDIWLYDPAGVAAPTSVTVSLAGATDLNDVVTAINAATPAAITASVTIDNRIQITTDGTLNFAFANDTSNFLQAAGLNTFFAGNDAGTISVNSAIFNDPNLIAVATITTSGAIYSGDNSNALLINTIRQNESVTFTNGDTTSLDKFYNSLVSDIGLTSKSVSWQRESAALTLNSLNELRDSVSGVSLDEEMANLIKYQQAYAAATKLITASDEMLATLLDSI